MLSILRTLLIGFEDQKLSGFGELVWSSWAGLQPFNIGDFDNVLVNLDSSVSDRNSLKSYLVSVNRQKVLEVLGNNGNLVYVGRFASSSGGAGIKTSHHIVSAFQFDWDTLGGTQVQVAKKSDERAVRYFKDVTGWSVALKSAALKDASGLSDQFGRQRFHYELETLARTKSGDAVAFYLHMTGGSNSGRIWFLPRPNVPDDALPETVMQFVHHLEKVPAPSWTQSIAAPNQQPIDDEIVDVQAKQVELDFRLQALKLERESLRLAIGLLYQTRSALEMAVWRARTDLGADVEEPIVQYVEDGWITVLGLEGVIEIKSTRKANFDEHGLNQVANWVQRGIHEREREYKAIYVGAAQMETPAEERTDPFSDSFKKKAVMAKIAVIKSEDLFALLVTNHDGRLERDAFWKALFVTNGVFDASPFLSAPEADPVG